MRHGLLLLLRFLQTTEDSLRTAFSKFGEVTDCFIPKDRETGKLKGFAFVSFANKRGADDAVKELDGSDWCSLKSFSWLCSAAILMAAM